MLVSSVTLGIPQSTVLVILAVIQALHHFIFNLLEHTCTQIIIFIPLQATSLGSGSQSPLLIHVVVLGPVSTNSKFEQVNVMIVPSLAGLLLLEECIESLT